MSKEWRTNKEIGLELLQIFKFVAGLAGTLGLCWLVGKWASPSSSHFVAILKGGVILVVVVPLSVWLIFNTYCFIAAALKLTTKSGRESLGVNEEGK